MERNIFTFEMNQINGNFPRREYIIRQSVITYEEPRTFIYERNENVLPHPRFIPPNYENNGCSVCDGESRFPPLQCESNRHPSPTCFFCVLMYMKASERADCPICKKPFFINENREAVRPTFNENSVTIRGETTYLHSTFRPQNQVDLLIRPTMNYGRREEEVTIPSSVARGRICWNYRRCGTSEHFVNNRFTISNNLDICECYNADHWACINHPREGCVYLDLHWGAASCEQLIAEKLERQQFGFESFLERKRRRDAEQAGEWGRNNIQLPARDEEEEVDEILNNLVDEDEVQEEEWDGRFPWDDEDQ